MKKKRLLVVALALIALIPAYAVLNAGSGRSSWR